MSQQPHRAAFRTAAAVVRPALNLMMGKEWRGLDKLPEQGFIAVANHISELDPLAVAHAVYCGGSTPHFMAKDSLFRAPVLGSALRGLKQVPVARSDRRAAQESLQVAQEVMDSGGAIIIYPEGTLTRDPDLWPMRAKTGAARLALSTGAPLIPITHWGVQDFFPPYAKAPRPLPRKRYVLQVGDPIDLSDLRDKPLGRAVLNASTERVEQALTDELAQLRGQTPPEGIWDRGAAAYVSRQHDSGPRAQAPTTKPQE